MKIADSVTFETFLIVLTYWHYTCGLKPVS